MAAESMKEPPESEPEMPEEGEDGEDEGEGDDYSEAGATIRQAIDEKDDAALAEAICHLIDIHTGKDEGEESESGPGKKPNLAVIIGQARGKK